MSFQLHTFTLSYKHSILVKHHILSIDEASQQQQHELQATHIYYEVQATYIYHEPLASYI